MAFNTSPNYIIIGGGASSLVIANRLSENSVSQVLVLEAGKDLTADPRVIVPAFWTTPFGSEADWQFQTVLQQRLVNRSVKGPQGKTLGGSSAINVQAFIAPARADIDAWAKLGNPDWAWEDLAPSYKKSYTLTLPEDEVSRKHLDVDWINDEYRSTDGPFKASFPGSIQNPLCKAWIDTFRGLNKITSGDPFSGNSIDGYTNQATVNPLKKKIGATLVQRMGCLRSRGPMYVSSRMLKSRRSLPARQLGTTAPSK